MNTLISYHGDENLKKQLVSEIAQHRTADQIIQGTYGEGIGKNWRGCAVGCSIHSLNRKLGKKYSISDHKVYEKALGLPEWLARLEDEIFDGLPKEEAMKWPEQFAQAIPVGVNVERVKWQFCSFILKENSERVLTLNISDELKKQVVESIQGVLAVHENALKSGIWDQFAAESAAWSAAESAAGSAARSAWSAWSAARSAAYQRYAKELLILLRKAK